MKIYLQTETLGNALPAEEDEGAAAGLRPRVLVMETAAAAEHAAQMLGAITQMLGRITAIPPAAHEFGLKALLPRDLAGHGITAGSGGEERAVVLKILREPGIVGPAGQADVTGLSYEVVVE